MSKKLLGKATIKVDGIALLTNEGAKLDIGGVERTTQTGGDRVQGYSEKPKPSKLECEISVNKDTNLKALGDSDNVTTTFEADTGQTWIQREAWLTNTPEVTAGDGGKVSLVFEAPPAEEMK